MESITYHGKKTYIITYSMMQVKCLSHYVSGFHDLR